MKQTFVIAAAAAAMFGAANASTISTRDYSDYTGGGYASGYYDFSEDGVNMRMTAGIYDDNDAALNIVEGGNGAYPRLYNGYGMGVSHDTDGEHTVDAYLAEMLILSFDVTVKLTDLVFNYINDEGKFDLFIDSDDDGTLDQRVLTDVDLSGSWDSVSLGGLLSMELLTGKLFGVGTSYVEQECSYSRKKRKTICKDKKSEWKLKYVKFEEVPEIPVPAALPLFLAGLGALGFAKRRKA